MNAFLTLPHHMLASSIWSVLKDHEIPITPWLVYIRTNAMNEPMHDDNMPQG